jgi:hypothetical protein
MAAQVNDAAWMEWISGLLGGSSRRIWAATLPPERYSCSLDELPIHLLPRPSVRLLQQELHRELSLNPDCLVQPADQLPPALTSQPSLVANFALQGMLAWVRDPVRKCYFPFWLGPEAESALQSLRPGQDARSVLSIERCRILLAAGILQSVDSRRPSESSPEFLDKLRKTFFENDYATFPGLIHAFHVAALRRYYRCLIRKGVIQHPDPQCPQRLVAHNEPVARFFHHQLTNIVSAVAGEPVKPSYVYLASYQPGAELRKHTDREQCEFSISFCLDFSPEPERETPWPLCLDTSQGKVALHQALGDGLFYRGTRVPHYRDVLGAGMTSTSIFFHYVSASFTGSMD